MLKRFDQPELKRADIWLVAADSTYLRYSQLTYVFGRLLYEGRLSEEDLRGLHEDKLNSIRTLAKFLAE